VLPGIYLHNSPKVFIGKVRVSRSELFSQPFSGVRICLEEWISHRLQVGEALLECFPRTSSRLERVAQSAVTLAALWERVKEIVPHNPNRFCGDD
jgi:hypothetical protein